MADFIVVAVYSSGTRYELTNTATTSVYNAVDHAARAQAALLPSEDWVYEVDMYYVGSDGQRHWRSNVTPEDLGYEPYVSRYSAPPRV